MRVELILLTVLLSAVQITTANETGAPTRVWVDTDIACGSAEIADVDDCLSLAYLLNSPDVSVVGISTVFGNAPLSDVGQALKKFEHKFRRAYPSKSFPPAYQGAAGRKWRHGSFVESDASRQIEAYFDQNQGVLLALGPLTNVARFESCFTQSLGA